MDPSDLQSSGCGNSSSAALDRLLPLLGSPRGVSSWCSKIVVWNHWPDHEQLAHLDWQEYCDLDRSVKFKRWLLTVRKLLQFRVSQINRFWTQSFYQLAKSSIKVAMPEKILYHLGIRQDTKRVVKKTLWGKKNIKSLLSSYFGKNSSVWGYLQKFHFFL
jgi:hypothetical protein